MHTRPLAPTDDKLKRIIEKYKQGQLTPEEASYQLNEVCRERNNAELFVLTNKLREKK